MKQIKWFDRKFEFPSDQNIFPSLVERLDGTVLRLEHRINHILDDHLTIKYNSKWSIQEHIGHLIDLEPLWQGRLEDILNGEEFLRPTDLQNTKTDLAKHNEQEVWDLLIRFKKLREETLDSVSSLSEKDIYKFALHPRLKTPMRTMDLFLFVAEHDDHHLAAIRAIEKAIMSD